MSRLKEDLLKVNMYAREANELAQHLNVDAHYSVTLQIPYSNLSPNGRVIIIDHVFPIPPGVAEN